MKHAAEWADVWYPTPPLDDPTLERSVPAFRALLEKNGRDADSVPIGVAPGAVDVALLETYRRLGICHVNLGLFGDTRDETLATLDELNELRLAVTDA
jgi:hypothetical protein